MIKDTKEKCEKYEIFMQRALQSTYIQNPEISASYFQDLIDAENNSSKSNYLQSFDYQFTHVRAYIMDAFNQLIKQDFDLKVQKELVSLDSLLTYSQTAEDLIILIERAVEITD